MVLVVVLALHQSRRAWAMNSSPLSDRMNAGAGFRLLSYSSTPTTSLAYSVCPPGWPGRGGCARRSRSGT